MKRYMIGIDLGGTNIKAGIYDNDFISVKEVSTPTEAAKGPLHVLERIRDAVRLITVEADISLDLVEGMGIGVPGLLDPVAGISFSRRIFRGGSKYMLLTR